MLDAVVKTAIGICVIAVSFSLMYGAFLLASIIGEPSKIFACFSIIGVALVFSYWIGDGLIGKDTDSNDHYG